MSDMMQMQLDWLAFTYKCRDTERFGTKLVDNMEVPRNHFDMFKIDFPEFSKVWEECFILERSAAFYDTTLSFNESILVSYTNDASSRDMGVNVSIPSHGLEWFFTAFGLDRNDPDCVFTLLEILYSRGCKLSRIDICFDDYTKTFRPRYYAQKWFDGEIVTKFRSINFTACKSDVGHTFYLGSRQTGKMLRIYDKDVESDGAKDCVRYEFELHSKYANELAEYLIKERSLPFPDYIRGWFTVVDRGNSKMPSSDRSRYKPDAAWNAFLDKVKFNEEFNVIHIPHYLPEASLESIDNFINNQVLPTLHAYIELWGFNFFHKMVMSTEIPKKYRNLIIRAKNGEFNLVS